jgi:peptide-methionine (S)-S-oxide reductase
MPDKIGSWRLLLGASVVAAVAAPLLLGRISATAAERTLPVPPAAIDETTVGSPAARTIVVSGGCFWGVQGVFEHLRGVTSAVSGYAGGAAATAQYEIVSAGGTGHAESVRITYDPTRISLGRILQVFFSVALDPTEEGYQGPDFGTQYRSEIWVADPQQQRVAQAYIAQLDQAHVFAKPIATRVDTLPGFYPAEAYHQDYLTLHPDNPYIAENDIPKVEALQRLFPNDYRAEPVTVGKLSSAS